MYKIEFLDQSGPILTSQTTPCPVCGATSAHAVLRVAAGRFLRRDAELVECAACATMYFPDADTVVGYDDPEFERDYWYNYVQNGAGINAMLEPLLAIDDGNKGDLLDIGCGFGFVAHFWKLMGHGDAVGLESSQYGKVGREKLGVDIIHSYYKDATEIAGRKFDYVFSSEVIEHVPDAKAFVREISVALKDDGILVLTTPCADAIRPGTDMSMLGAILSPGFHFFVTRAKALEDVLTACGFAHVKVQNTGTRLFAWASRRPLPDIRTDFQDWPHYFDYLEHLSKLPDPHVAGGALYRLLKDSINLGLYDWSDRAYPFFEALAKSVYGIDFRNPQASRPAQSDGKAPDYSKFPSWTGCGYLFAGRYLEHEGHDPAMLAPIYRAATETMRREVADGAQFAQEPYYFLGMAEAALAAVENKLAVARETGRATVKADPQVHPIVWHRAPEQAPDGREICILVGFAPTGKASPGAIALLDALSDEGIDCYLCLAVNDTATEVDLTGLDRAKAIMCRKNGGFDFAVWAAALADRPDIWNASRIYFVNDSILGPLRGFQDVLTRIRSSDADFVALTDSFDSKHHVQSYFFVLQGQALSNWVVRKFWRQVRVLAMKDSVISAYELTQLAEMRDAAGLKVEVLFSLEKLFPGVDLTDLAPINPTHQLWEHLLHSGFPFVKAELLCTNPLGLPIHHWPAMVELYGGDLGVFRAHLDERQKFRAQIELGEKLHADREAKLLADREALERSYKAAIFFRENYDKWKLLRAVIGDDRFFALRDKRLARKQARKHGGTIS